MQNLDTQSEGKDIADTPHYGHCPMSIGSWFTRYIAISAVQSSHTIFENFSVAYVQWDHGDQAFRRTWVKPLPQCMQKAGESQGRLFSKLKIHVDF